MGSYFRYGFYTMFLDYVAEKGRTRLGNPSGKGQEDGLAENDARGRVRGCDWGQERRKWWNSFHSYRGGTSTLSWPRFLAPLML
jgi:hypothetical protein